MTLHEALVKARNRIEGRYCKTLYDDGKVCAYGALYIATQGEPCLTRRNRIYTTSKTVREVHAQYPELTALLCKYIKQDDIREIMEGDLVGFNDSTSEQRVLELFDKMIADTAPKPEDLELEEPVEPSPVKGDRESKVLAAV